MTISEIHDPELILEEPEPPEVIEGPDEDSPPIHTIIPTNEDELAESTSKIFHCLEQGGCMRRKRKL